MKLPLAISPCPNDTYLFLPWINGLIDTPLTPFVTFADIETLNEMAMRHELPLIKVSFACFEKVTDAYELLPIGSALGKGCGPLLIARKQGPFETVAIPGTNTTAHALYRRLIDSPAKKRFCFYHEVVPMIQSGEVDAGVIIHETRFTYEKQGLVKLADLGELWARPIPLGGLAVAKDLPSDVKAALLETLQKSIQFSDLNPERFKKQILETAQEKEWSIAKKHIDLYVTTETRALSPAAIEAIEEFLPSLPPNKKWLYETSDSLYHAH